MLGFIQAVITLGPIIAQLISWYKGLSEESQIQFIADVRSVFSELDHPTTSGEKKDVAKSIQNLIRRL